MDWRDRAPVESLPVTPPHARAAAMLLVLALGACTGASAPEPTSVVLISLDTTRRDALGLYGAPRPTPRLDALAEASAVFEDCQAQSTATAPSHMSILTGMSVQRHGLLKNGETSTPTISLASVLRDAGYRTAAFTGHGSLQGKFGPGYGFDVFVSWPEDEPATGEGAEYQRSIREAAAEGLAFLDTLPEGTPFFLFVHGYDPHLPYWPPEPLRSEYAGWYHNDLKIAALHNHASIQPMLADGTIGEEELR
ncbi:MAG TPA: hypothetical protein ENJ09_14710, partial [Planctomycetes bacterium]|nr:hypothetical protein [Planctomycetota bacterium]